jgi:hypothetical protein
MWVEKNHKVPVVHWSEEWCCAQKEGYNGSSNPWEYYFEPVSHLTYEKGDVENIFSYTLDSYNIVGTFLLQRGRFDKERRFTVKKLIDKYIKVKPNILEKVNSFYEKKLRGKTTIGIHLRGTDRLHEEGLYAAILDAAEQAASTAAGDVQFFVATDQESLLDLAKEILKRPIVYCDSHRSRDASPVHLPKEGHKTAGAILGEEALIEALLLSKCNFLVHSFSSLPIAVLTLNPNLPYEYVDPAKRRH